VLSSTGGARQRPEKSREVLVRAVRASALARNDDIRHAVFGECVLLASSRQPAFSFASTSALLLPEMYGANSSARCAGRRCSRRETSRVV